MMQKYKIFLNEQLLSVESLSGADKRNNSILITSPHQLLLLFRELEIKGGSGDFLLETALSPFELLAESCKWVTAAGGLVFNEKDELLLIYRHSTWDLPKGKIKKKEALDKGALREVTEETGLQNIRIVSEMGTSYHIFKGKSRYILKETAWYEMKFEGDETPVPQTEESITDVKWFGLDEIPGLMQNSYRSLRELTEEYLKKR